MRQSTTALLRNEEVWSMTEAEALAQISVYLEQMYMLLQWWVSVSFGLVAAAHFFAKRLNLSLLIFLLFAYTAYTVFIFSHVGLQIQWNIGLMEYLSTLQERTELSPTGQGFAATPGEPSFIDWAQGLGQLALFVGTVAFLLVSYIRRRDESA